MNLLLPSSRVTPLEREERLAMGFIKKEGAMAE